jgi:hypothetical protein
LRGHYATTRILSGQHQATNQKIMNPNTARSPRSIARMAGVFYLLTALTSVIGESFIPGKLVISGDATATANNMLAHPILFQFGFASLLISVVFSVALTALFYQLFKPVNKNISLTAALIHIVGLAVLAVSGLLLYAPVVVLKGGKYLGEFSIEQQKGLAYMFLQLNIQAWNVFIAFFGFYCVLIGYLIFRSVFLPRIIGALMIFTGLGYLTFLLPALSDYLSPYNLAPAAFGELSLMIWLLAKGVNNEKWNQQAGLA